MLVETWTDGEETFNVVRVSFKAIISDIIDTLKDLPPGSQVWETLACNGETVEIVFRSVQAFGAVA